MPNPKQQIAAAALENIEQYYWASFKVPPLKCRILLVSFLQQMEKLLPLLGAAYAKRLQPQLDRLAQALNSNDYVLLRDVLWYEIKPLLRKL